jgi:hypothetical protein
MMKGIGGTVTYREGCPPWVYQGYLQQRQQRSRYNSVLISTINKTYGKGQLTRSSASRCGSGRTTGRGYR